MNKEILEESARGVRGITYVLRLLSPSRLLTLGVNLLSREGNSQPGHRMLTTNLVVSVPLAGCGP
jgi:hypothetical protein